MDFDDYQQRAAKTARYPKKPIAWLYPALALAEEAGEVSGKLAKIVRDKGFYISTDDKLAITKELGDVLWDLTALATELDIDLKNIALTNIWKLEQRAEKGTIQGSGDER